MASSSHVPNISQTVFLEALSTPQAGFGTVTLLVDQAAGTGNDLGASTPRYVEVADLDEAQALRDAGYITAAVLAACTVAFSQTPTPSKFRICRVDTAAGTPETYLVALAALLNTEVASDVWMLCMDSRTAATQVALATGVAARSEPLFLWCQSADADWITSGVPAAFADYVAIEEFGVMYHSTSSEWEDVAAACRFCAFDPDEKSAPGEGPLAGVASYSSFLTPTQRGYAIANNAAVLGTWGSSDYWLDNAVNITGRPIYEPLTSAVFQARIKEDIQTLHQREATYGRKILVAASGQRQVQAVIERRLGLMVNAGHFIAGQTEVTALAITAADITARRLRFQVRAQIGTAVRTFTITSYLSQTPVIEVAA